MVNFKCLVQGCENTHMKHRPKKKFHRFPKEETRLEEWKAALQISDDKLPTMASVCSDHFRNEDYLVKGQSHWLLEKDATPSLNLGYLGNDTSPHPKRKRSDVLMDSVKNIIASVNNQLAPESIEGNLEADETDEVTEGSDTTPVEDFVEDKDNQDFKCGECNYKANYIDLMSHIKTVHHDSSSSKTDAMQDERESESVLLKAAQLELKAKTAYWELKIKQAERECERAATEAFIALLNKNTAIADYNRATGENIPLMPLPKRWDG